MLHPNEKEKHVRMYILIFIAILFIFSGNVFCQQLKPSKNSADVIVPQSPKVAALTRYGEYPTELCYGLVNISIPIYTIKTKQLEFPISISYHSSGIKVNEIASNVGLGWSLNAGGLISVDIRGANDSKNEFLTEKQIDSLTYSQNENDVFRAFEELSNVASGYDAQSDLYYYTAGNIQGHFTYNNEGEMFEIPLTDNRIETSTAGSQLVYTITSSDGTRYVFGGSNIAKTGTPGGRVMITAYLLDRIVSADGNDSITFVYRDTPIYYSITPNFECTKECDLTKVADYGSCKSLVTTSSTSFYDKEIASIRFEGGEVVFDSDDKRQDIGSSLLKSIMVYQTKGKTKTKLMDCLFSQSYFISDDCNNAYSKNEKCFKRLRLDKLTLQYRNATDRVYEFAYNPTSLPCYDFDARNTKFGAIGDFHNDSYAQDTWGYYNGKKGNRHLLRYSTEIPVEEFKRMTGCIDIPDFKADANFAQANILTYIKYPTGGYSHFTYEGNSELGGLRIKTIENNDRNSDLLEKHEFTYCAPQDITVDKFIPKSLFYKRTYTYVPSRAEMESSNSNATFEKKEYTIYTSSPAIQQTLYTAPAYYTNISEKISNKNGKGIVKEYHYNYIENDIRPNMGHSTGTLIRYPYKVKDNFWKRGNLVELLTYDITNNGKDLLRKEYYNYEFLNKRNEAIGLVATNDKTEINNSVLGRQIDSYFITTNYDWFSTWTSTGYKCLLEKRITDFDKGGASSTISEKYEYGNLSSKQPTCQITQKTITNGNNSYITKYIYPHDINVCTQYTTDSRGIESLRKANVKALPVEELHYVQNDGKSAILTSGNLYRYKEVNRLWQHYRLYPSSDMKYEGITQVGIAGLNMSKDYLLELEQDFDNHNNVVQQIRTDGMYTSYIWTNNGIYPIAMVKNVYHNTLVNALESNGTSVDDVYKAEDPISKLKGIDKILPYAELALFDNDNMQRVTYMSDANGHEQRFAYDGMGRLLTTKENERIKMEATYKEDNETTFHPEIRFTSEFHQYGDVVLYVTSHPMIGQSHKWTIMDSDGNIVATGNKANISFCPQQKGAYKVYCVITDNDDGKSQSLERTMEVGEPLPLEAGIIITSDSILRVGNNMYAFSASATGGSGCYEYEWSLSNNLGIVSSNNQFAKATFSKEGNTTITYIVTDTKTRQKATYTMSINVLPPLDPVVMMQEGFVQYIPRETYSPLILVDPQTGSGNYKYEWKIYDGEGESIKIDYDKSGKASCMLSSIGRYRVECTITDLYNNHVVNVTYDVEVLQSIGFVSRKVSRNGSRRTMTGILVIPEDMCIKVEYGTTRDNNPKNSSICFKIGSHSYTMTNGSSKTCEQSINLKQGEYDVEMSLDVPDGNNRIIEVWIKLLLPSEDYYFINKDIIMNEL